MIRKATMGLALLLSASGALAQDLPPIETYQAMLDANKQQGWVQFRNYDGRQLVYFTPLLSLHCRLGEIRYSINSDALDQTWPIPECNPYLPFSLPDDIPIDHLLLDLELGTAKAVSVQVSFTGGKKQTNVVTFAPCPDVGEMTCARILQESE